jgi:hypothetical protein
MLIVSGLLRGGNGEVVQFQSPPIITGKSPKFCKSFVRLSKNVGQCELGPYMLTKIKTLP